MLDRSKNDPKGDVSNLDMAYWLDGVLRMLNKLTQKVAQVAMLAVVAQLGVLGIGAMGLGINFEIQVNAQDTRKLTDVGTWEKLPSYPPDSPQGKLHLARKAIASGDGDDAEEMMDDWLEEYPNHERTPDAYLIRGDARVKQHSFYKALFDYEMLIGTYPGSEHFKLALEREYEIANLFANGVKRKLWGMRIIPFGQLAHEEAEELFARIQERVPGSALGEKAMLRLAEFYYDTAQMYKATNAYELFTKNYPDSDHRERAMRRLIQAGLATFKGPRFNSRGLLDARTRLSQYRAEFPASAERIGTDALLVRIEESQALKSYFHAQWYERRNEMVSAVYMYNRVKREFPKTAAAQQAIAKLQQLEPSLAPTSNKNEAVLTKPKKNDAQDADAKPDVKPDAKPSTKPKANTNEEANEK